MADYRVLDRDLLTPPASPAEGDYYIMPAGTLTGAWAAYGIANLAHFADAAWEEVVPSPEETAVVVDEVLTLVYKGSPDYWIESQYWRERLTAPRTYYVRAAGNDANDGLTVGTAVNTISKAIELAAALDTNNYNITINCDEVRTHSTSAILKRLTGGGIGTILGKSSIDTIISLSAQGACIDAEGDDQEGGVGEWYINQIKLTGSPNSLVTGVSTWGLTYIGIGSDVDFAYNSQDASHIAVGESSLVFALAGYKVSGGCFSHLYLYKGGRVDLNGTIALNNGLAFGRFAKVLTRTLLDIVDATFTGSSITGPRFEISAGGEILASSLTQIPGDAIGALEPGGIYVGGSTVLRPFRDNFAASSDPTASDDAAVYYGVGSRWINTTDDRVWTCVDATAGAAVWKLVGGQAVTIQSAQNPLINNLFQVWQRGVSFADPANAAVLADRWRLFYNGSGATRTLSRQQHTLGDELLTASPYFLRWAESVAGSGATFKNLYQLVPGVRTLAGRMVRAWILAKAASNVTTPDSAINQYFGTGGSPTAQKGYNIGPVTITTAWQFLPYAAVTLADLTDVTLGSNGNDYLQLWLSLPLAATFTIDIAGAWIVEDGAPLPGALCFEDELKRCLPFFQKSFDTATAPVQNAGVTTGEFVASALVAGAVANRLPFVPLQTPMRAAPTVTLYNPAAANAQARDETAGVDCSSTSAVFITQKGFSLNATGNAATAVNNRLGVHWSANAEL